MGKKISGRTIATKIKEQVAEELKTLKKTPGIAAILVGKDPASHLYVGIKEKECNSIGIHFEKLLFPETLTENELMDTIKLLNKKMGIDAILVQLPLPKHINTEKIIAELAPEKDVDGFQEENTYVRPVLLMAIEEILRSTGAKLNGKKTVVICNSEIFCSTMKKLKDTFELNISCLSAKQIKNLKEVKSSEADVVIIAAGIPKLVTSDMIKEGAILIDIGTNETPEGIVGDATPSAYKKTSFYTPVPGGVGPVTVACLLKNAVKLAKLHQQEIKE